MIKLLQENMNLLNLNLSEDEVRKTIDSWKPKANNWVFSIKNQTKIRLQSVNKQTQFVTLRLNDVEQLTISFQQLKEEYIPILTMKQLKKIIVELPDEYESLKEKLTSYVSVNK